MRGLVILVCLGGLLAAVEGADAAKEAAPPLDAATVARAEAAADAFLAGDEPSVAKQPKPELGPEALALDQQQHEDLSQVEVLLLEAKTHLESGQSLPAGERYLAAQELLAALPRRISDPQDQAQLRAARNQLLRIGRVLLSGGHLAPADQSPADDRKGPVETE